MGQKEDKSNITMEFTVNSPHCQCYQPNFWRQPINTRDSIE